MSKRLLSLVLVLAIACSMLMVPSMASAAKTMKSDDYNGYIRYIPVKLAITSNKITVTGYFVNLNTDKVVKKLLTPKIGIYYDNELLLDGKFKNISITINPGRTKKHTLIWNGKHDFNLGTWYMYEDDYATVDCYYNYTWY